MKHYNVIIIGGGPSGIVAGTTSQKHYRNKSFLLIKEEEKGLIPCGIPYIFHLLGDIDKDLMGPKPFIDAGGDVLVDAVTDVNLENRVVETKSGKQFKYDKLIFATGSTPVIPKFIKGYDLENVLYVRKSYNYMKTVKEKTDVAENIVIIGGGFIGVEVAEQLADSGKNVYLVEKEKHCLYRAFSVDLCERAEEIIKDTNINLVTNASVQEIIGKNGKVDGVKLADGSIIKADLVILSIGYKPNTDLAKKAGLDITSTRAIRVDNYQRTALSDVYAIGDCSQKVGFITGRTDNIMLASTATAEARILAYNLYQIKLKRNHAGTLSVFSTEINGTAFASAGAIEQSAGRANVEFIVGQFEDVDRHPGSMPDASKLFVKLIVSPGDGSIIGGEICGGKSIGELINVVALAIQKNLTVFELVSFQVGTHPLLTSAPTKYILIKAAEDAIRKIYNSE